MSERLVSEELGPRSIPRRRTQLEIILVILELAAKGVTKTALVYRSNLNFAMIQRYLSLLMEKGLIKQSQVDGSNEYFTTTKGVEAIRKLSDAVGLLATTEPMDQPSGHTFRNPG